MVCISAALLVDGGRQLLFRQRRLGRLQRPFEILKFRTMRDERVTRAGRLLRATGLDELPQLLNILRSDRSAVGPRPVTREDALRYRWLDDHAASLWTLTPVLTGLAHLAARSPAEGLPVSRCYA